MQERGGLALDWKQAAVLGVLQGLTEFLPVSSSGHLVLAQHLLGIREPQLAFDVAVHLGTALAVMWVMRRTLLDVVAGVARWPWIAMGRPVSPEDGFRARLAGWVALASVPAAIAGLLGSDAVESWFAGPRRVAVAMAVTGLALWWAPRRQVAGDSLDSLGAARALAVGLAQAVAILPGISRSGATVVTGLWAGLRAEEAARFSFLLSIPAILGAAALSLIRVAAGSLPAVAVEALVSGVLLAALTGYAAILVLLRALQRGRLRPFAVYLWAVAVVAWWLSG